MGNKNRDKGNRLERLMRNLMMKAGWENCQTSRYASREMDDQCVDLVNTNPFFIQCKATKNKPSYDVFDKMPTSTNYNILVHKDTSKFGGRTIVWMELNDWLEIVEQLKVEVW